MRPSGPPAAAADYSLSDRDRSGHLAGDGFPGLFQKSGTGNLGQTGAAPGGGGRPAGSSGHRRVFGSGPEGQPTGRCPTAAAGPLVDFGFRGGVGALCFSPHPAQSFRGPRPVARLCRPHPGAGGPDGALSSRWSVPFPEYRHHSAPGIDLRFSGGGLDGGRCPAGAAAGAGLVRTLALVVAPGGHRVRFAAGILYRPLHGIIGRGVDRAFFKIESEVADTLREFQTALDTRPIPGSWPRFLGEIEDTLHLDRWLAVVTDGSEIMAVAQGDLAAAENWWLRKLPPLTEADSSLVSPRSGPKWQKRSSPSPICFVRGRIRRRSAPDRQEPSHGAVFLRPETDRPSVPAGDLDFSCARPNWRLVVWNRCNWPGRSPESGAKDGNWMNCPG